MLDAVAVVLAEYPQAVMATVTDPRTGLPGKSKWPPSVPEVREACEIEMAPIRRQMARERASSMAPALAAPEDESPSYEALRAKYGPSYGIGGRASLVEQVYARSRVEREPFRTMTDDELTAHYGRREAAE
jgi:hypothetical protein